MFNFLKKRRGVKQKKVFFTLGVIIFVSVALFVSYSFSQEENRALLDISFSSDNYDVSTKTFYDRSGSGNDGISINSVNFVDGRYGSVDGAMSFNGVNDYINLSKVETAELTNASVSFWRKAVDSTNWLILRGNTNSHYLMAVSTGNFYHANVGASVKVYEDGKQVLKDTRDGKWHHYVATGVNFSTWTTMTLNNYGGWQYKGALDGIRIYNYSLSAEEVNVLYNTEKPVTSLSSVTSEGLVAHWRMGDNYYVEGTENVLKNTNLDTGWGKGYQSNIIFNEIESPLGPGYSTVGHERAASTGYWYSYGDYAPQEPGATYTVSLYVKTLDSNFKIRFYTADNSEVGRFSSGQIAVPNDGNWHRVVWPSFQNPANSESDSLSFNFSYGGAIGDPSTRTWFSVPQMEKKDHATPFVSGTRLGRLVDLSPYSNHGSSAINESFTLTEDRFGKEGGAMVFSGDPLTSHISIVNPIVFQDGEPWSVSLWVYRQVPPSTDRGGIGNRGYPTISFQNSNALFWINSSNMTTLSFGKPITDSWHMLTFIVNQNREITTFVDGQQTSSATLSSGYFRISSIGSGNTTNRPFKGYMDDIRVYNRALSESEIKSLYDSYNPKTTTGSLRQGLILDLPLKSKYTKSETVGSEIMTDRTPYSHDGQNYGAIITNEGAAFDGNDYISIGSGSNYFPLPLFSFCSWISSPGLAPEMTVNGIFTLTYGLRFTLNASGNFSTSIDNGSTFVTINDTANLHDNEFHHLCLTYDGVDRHMFVDGVKKISTPTVWSGISRWPTNGVRIGHDINHPARYSFNGKISNFLIYNRALLEDEVKTLYNRGRSDAGIIFQTEN